MNPVTLQNNIDTQETFFKIAGRCDVTKAKVNEGNLCLGAQGDRLVVVDFGNSFLSSIIRSIVNFFTGVKLGEKVNNLVAESQFERAKIHLTAQSFREGAAAKAKAVYDATTAGQISNFFKVLFGKN